MAKDIFSEMPYLPPEPSNVGTVILNNLIKEPWVFFLDFILQPLPVAALAYGLVWLAMRPKDGRKVNNPGLWHSCGVAATVIGSAIFRIVAMVTFAGRDAYEFPKSTFHAFYLFIVPAIVATGYIAWLKMKALSLPEAAQQKNEEATLKFPETSRTTNATPPAQPTAGKSSLSHLSTIQSDKAEHEESADRYAPELKNGAIKLHSLGNPVINDEAFYEKAFVELESKDMKVGLWAKVFAEAQGNEALAKATYLTVRSGQFADEYKQTILEEERQRQKENEIAEMERQRQEIEKIPQEQIRSLAKQLQSQPFVNTAKDLVNKLGGTIKYDSKSWLYIGMIVNLYGETHEFANEYDFAQWVRNDIAPRILGS
ncbi:MAG: hypothetical protein ACOYOS_19900 [Syntrophales bacterium]